MLTSRPLARLTLLTLAASAGLAVCSFAVATAVLKTRTLRVG